MVVYGANTWTCNGGIFKQLVHKAHSVGTKAALGNCLSYDLDTVNKSPTSTVLTKPAGEKEINFNARENNIRFTTPEPKVYVLSELTICN